MTATSDFEELPDELLMLILGSVSIELDRRARSSRALTLSLSRYALRSPAGPNLPFSCQGVEPVLEVVRRGQRRRAVAFGPGLGGY